jgi:CheY-like chemotaxis protein
MPTALIVEDEAEANKLLAMLLALRGYEADSAFSGEEALAKVRTRVPDVILLDLMLPDLDGYDVCRSLKASRTTSKIPVIIVTARVAAANRIHSFRAGADDYIPKPYTPDQVFEALDLSGSWRCQMRAPLIDGRVALDERDDGETLRRLAQLRNLLIARSRLPIDAIDGISAVIDAIWTSALKWSQDRRLDQVATLAYSLTSDSLTLTVHDEGSWLAGPGRQFGQGLSASLASASFDEFRIDQTAGSLTLFKRLSRPTTS